MKIILNKCFGGFSVSKEATLLYAKKKGYEVFAYRRCGSSLNNLRKINPLHCDNLMDLFVIKDYGEYVVSDIPWKEEKVLCIESGYREDEILIEVVEELGEKANGSSAELKVVEIPDGLDYVIDDYDGMETLHERVQEW